MFTGAVLGTLVAWLSQKYIPKQQLGFTNNLTRQAIVLSQICLLGLNHTILIYIHKYADTGAKKKVFITLCLLIPVVFALVAAVPYYYLQPWVLHHFQPADVPFMQRYYMLLPVYSILFILMNMLELYLGAQMKVAVSAFMREVVLRVITIAIILLYAFGYVSFDFLVIGTVAAYLLPVLIFAALSVKTEAFGVSFKFSAFSRAEYKDLIHFSWFHFLLTLSITLMAYLDGLALPLYDHSGFNSVAVYGIAMFLISFMQMPSKAMLIPTITVLSQAIAADDKAKAKDIFGRSSINILVATTLMAVLIICNLDNATALLNKGYGQVGLIFIILALGRFVDLATGLNDVALSITKYYKFSFYVSMAMIALLFGLIRYLVPIYGVYGAAWATSITLICFNICKYFFVWKKLDMQPFSVNTLLVLVAGAATFAAGYYFPNFLKGKGHMYIYTIIDATIRCGLIMVVYLLMLYWLKPSPDVREYIASIKKNRKLF